MELELDSSKKPIFHFSLLRYILIKLLSNLISIGENSCYLTSKLSPVACSLQMSHPKPKKALSLQVKLISPGIVRPVFRQIYSL